MYVYKARKRELDVYIFSYILVLHKWIVIFHGNLPFLVDLLDSKPPYCDVIRIPRADAL